MNYSEFNTLGKTSWFRIPAVLLLSAAMIAPVSAQDDEEYDEDDVYQLSPYEVQADAIGGYVASNVMSAYRINATIKEIPMNIQVVTEEFMEDQAAVNLNDALQYSAGVTIAATSLQEQDSYNIRGLRASRPKRNGYRRYYMSDMTNVARVEIVKGPASAIFGEAQPGGIINYITKRPQAEPATELSFRYGSWDDRRIAIGNTGPFLKDDESLLYRIDASYQKANGYRDFEEEERAVVAPVVSWQITEKTKVILDVEYLYKKFNPPSGNLIWNEEATRAYWEKWVGAAPEDWADLPEATAAFYEVLQNDPTLGVQFRFLTQPTDNPTTDGAIRYTGLYPIAPLTYATNGPDTYTEYETITYTAEVQQKFFENLSARALVSYGSTDTEIIRSNTQRVRVWGDGFQQGKRFDQRENGVLTAQFDVMTTLELGPTKHRLIVGAEHLSDDFENFLIRNDVPGGANESQMMVLFPETYQLFLDYDLSFPTPEKYIVGINRIGPEDFYDENGDPILIESDFESERDLNSIYISDQMSLFNDRVKVLVGLRHDRVEQTILRGVPAGETAPYEAPELEATSPQAGINWYLNGSIVLYANYSESFTPVEGLLRNRDGTNSPKPPEIGEGGEIGIKGSFLDGRISATMAVFDISKQDVVRPALDEFGERYDILAEGQSSQGFELDVVAYPTANLQLVLGYAYMESEEVIEEGELAYDSKLVGVPENQFSFWSKYSFLEGWLEGLEIGAGLNYLGERRGGQTNRDLITLDEYVKVDALVAYKFTRGPIDYKLALRVDNVLDELYFRPGMYVGDPRNYTLTLTLRF